MRNPAQLAASLAGRPLLMRDSAVPQYARMLGVLADGRERRSQVSEFFTRARRMFSTREESATQVEAPTLTVPFWMGEPDAVGYGWILKDGIGVIHIEGPLMAEGFGWGSTWYHGYDTLNAAYEEMFADARVLGILSINDSPGGIADEGLPEWAATVRNGREASGGKPCWAYVKTSYSAMYWGTAQHDWIVGGRMCGVGSIGAVINHCEMSRGLDADGITTTKFVFGKKKADGAFDEPLSDTAKADFDADVQQCGRWFVADVLAGRPSLSEEQILATEAGCYYGDSDDPNLSGLQLGLIDAVMSERQAFAALVAKVSNPSPPSVARTGAANASDKEIDMKRSVLEGRLKAAGLNKDQIATALAEGDATPEKKDDETGGDEGAGSGDDGEKDDDVIVDDEKDDKPSSEAAKISASAEAKTHPQLALAAISSGQSLAQFKANVSAQAGAPKPRVESKLDKVMARSARLGPDGAKPAGEGGAHSNAMAARAKANREKTGG
jgi:ClpP class serine protease